MRVLGNIQNSVDAGMFFLGNWVLCEEMDGGTKTEPCALQSALGVDRLYQPYHNFFRFQLKYNLIKQTLSRK